MREMDQDIKAKFSKFSETQRDGLMLLRSLIFAEAQTLPQIGPLQEVLKWGQPSYVTPESKAATTLRLGTHQKAEFALYAHCQSTVIASYEARFPGWDRIDGNRAVLFNNLAEIEPFRLKTLIRHALTYHLN